jgi:hypothetical protein
MRKELQLENFKCKVLMGGLGVAGGIISECIFEMVVKGGL